MALEIKESQRCLYGQNPCVRRDAIMLETATHVRLRTLILLCHAALRSGMFVLNNTPY